MSIKLSLKVSKSFFLTFFFIISCSKTVDKKIVIKVGNKSWEIREVQTYFKFYLKDLSTKNIDTIKFKKTLLQEIIFRSLIENWAKKNNLKAKKIPLKQKEQENFLKYNSNLKALKNYKNYLSLQALLLDELFKRTPPPSLKEQKNFYKKNKSQFFEPASCFLKQILVEKDKFAQTLYKRIKNGDSFDTLSKLYSLKKNPEKIKKGDLEVFDKACFQSKESLSQVLKSPYGYHIFQVEKRHPRKQKTFKMLQKQILYFLQKNKSKQQFQLWLKEESAKTSIFIDKNLLDKIHIQYKNK